MDHFAAIAAVLEENGLDAMLLTEEANRFYATGFHSIGTDGCAAPNFAVPLKTMAEMYGKLVLPPKDFDLETREACRRIVSAMMSYPEMIAMAGGKAVWVEATEAEGFVPPIERIRAAGGEARATRPGRARGRG